MTAGAPVAFAMIAAIRAQSARRSGSSMASMNAATLASSGRVLLVISYPSLSAALQPDQRRDVLAGLASLDQTGIVVQRIRQHRGLEVQFIQQRCADPEILQQQLWREAGLERIGEHGPAELFEEPVAGRAAAEQFEHFIPGKTEFLDHRQTLAYRLGNAGDNQLVDRLGRLPGP